MKHTVEVFQRTRGDRKVIATVQVDAPDADTALDLVIASHGLEGVTLKADESYTLKCGDVLTTRFGDEFTGSARATDESTFVEPAPPEPAPRYATGGVVKDPVPMFPHIPPPIIVPGIDMNRLIQNTRAPGKTELTWDLLNEAIKDKQIRIPVPPDMGRTWDDGDALSYPVNKDSEVGQVAKGMLQSGSSSALVGKNRYSLLSKTWDPNHANVNIRILRDSDGAIFDYDFAPSELP